MEKEILSLYEKKKSDIQNRLRDFQILHPNNYLKEHIFCLLTPQSNAHKCWEAVEIFFAQKPTSVEQIAEILKTKTRFHNTKARRVIVALSVWDETKKLLDNKNIFELRNELAEKINGYGLKEEGHFLRNIGKSNSEIAILDRHILRNLKLLRLISEEKIKNRKNYFEVEKIFKDYSLRTGIPMDELDLLFWSKENGTIFK